MTSQYSHSLPIFICVGEFMHLFILFFKPSFCNWPETELKWKADIENLYDICISSYTDIWCLVPFSRNISCDRKHNVCLCCDYSWNGVALQSPNKPFFSSEWSTQQANYCTKHAITNRIPVTTMLIRVNEASDWNSSSKRFEWSGMAKKEMESVA